MRRAGSRVAREYVSCPIVKAGGNHMVVHLQGGKVFSGGFRVTETQGSGIVDGEDIGYRFQVTGEGRTELQQLIGQKTAGCQQDRKNTGRDPDQKKPGGQRPGAKWASRARESHRRRSPSSRRFLERAIRRELTAIRWQER